MTERQPYEVVGEHPGFELRRYPAHHLAETVVAGSFEGAGNTAFRALFRYITGRNRSGTSIAMTAPVVQEGAAESGSFVVSFVMPRQYADEPPPAPDDPAVRVRRVPGHLAAATRFSGRWSRRSYEQHAEQLLRDIAAAGLSVDGPMRFARYDPPWTPWFLRRNEVVVPIAE
jgi:effector-binding domain-containing protein